MSDTVIDDECTVEIAKSLGVPSLVERFLKEYSEACTTRIIGVAVEECNRLSYDPDQIFDRFDVLDPDFPLTVEDEFDEDIKPRPDQVLEYICNNRIDIIVEAMGDMEKCWETGSRIKDTHTAIVCRLWEFAKEEAEHHVLTLYGRSKQEEFSRMGDEFFFD